MTSRQRGLCLRRRSPLRRSGSHTARTGFRTGWLECGPSTSCVGARSSTAISGMAARLPSLVALKGRSPRRQPVHPFRHVDPHHPASHVPSAAPCSSLWYSTCPFQEHLRCLGPRNASPQRLSRHLALSAPPESARGGGPTHSRAPRRPICVRGRLRTPASAPRRSRGAARTAWRRPRRRCHHGSRSYCRAH